MHGRGVENWRRVRRRLMCTTRTVLAAGDRVIADFFFKVFNPLVWSYNCDVCAKDGRKISVGECALFKPPRDSPPFIGIIRCLKSKEENPQLGVNWLYRPADVKLGKGAVLGAAPNEIFYSFHTDEIPAASLLHPCKVAFLPKGVELPPGTSSFICRRVYDIANKCLWWLTDPDYIDERQEEVNQLLSKTQKEMHATLQSGSPKPVNGPTSTSQVKTSSDNIQNCAPSFPSNNKRKKREHGDHGMESVKRERSLKADDSDSNHFKADNLLKSEISSITEKGGLVDSEGVEKLVKLMQPDRADKKMDLASRSMLVGSIAVTDKFDCLTQFLQLRGLPVLDEWLQDIHKGKIDAGKDGDKAVEEFLLVLLRALDKLPVNLQALQMCNIGRSVNHLRTNKNVEIQKKARSLVDTWKKRVEAEMNIIETKSGSSQAVPWPSKSRVDVSHGAIRHGGGSCEISRKNSGSLLPASKSSSPKPLLGETASKSASSSPGPIKTALSPGAGKDGQIRIAVASDLPSTPVREEKSSSSSQSHTHSQSLSGKEDARSSTAGSMSVNKISTGTSRHRKSVNGGSGPVGSGIQRETASSKTISLSASNSERVSGLTCEKALDIPAMEGKNHKLIVKIPNRGRSPALSTGGGLSEDPSMMNSRASSPLPSEKHDHSDGNIREKNDPHQVNVTSEVSTESLLNNDTKDVLTGSGEGNISPAVVHNDEQSRNDDDVRKLAEVSKVASSPWNELSSDIKYKGSIPFSTAVQASSAARDDVGMNLLASVAAGEMPKSNAVSSTDSPGDPASKIRDNQQGDSLGGTENKKKLAVFDGSLQCKHGVLPSTNSVDDVSSGRKNTSCSSKETPVIVLSEHSNSFNVDPLPTAEKCLETSEKAEIRDSASVAASPVCNEKMSEQQEGKTAVTTLEDTHQRNGNDSLLAEDKGNAFIASSEGEKQADEVHSSEYLRKEAQKNTLVTEECNDGFHSEQKPIFTGMKYMNMEEADKAVLHSCSSTKDLGSENHEGFEIEKAEELDNRSSTGKAGGERSVQDTNDSIVIKGIAGTAQRSAHLEVEVESKEAWEEHSGESVSHKESPVSRCKNTGQRPAFEEGTGEHACRIADASLSREGVVDARLAFDLNEGLTTEEGKLGKSSNLSVPECTSSMHVINPLPFPVSSISCCLPASITVAAPAKGPFVPIQDLLRSKGELGWKGSAATSAFRPAEPRKVLDMPSVSLPGATGSKNERPLLDFDLNVADDRVMEDNMGSQDLAVETGSVSGVKSNTDLARIEKTGSVRGPTAGRLELDLNSVVETTEIGRYPSTSGSLRLESSLLQVKSGSPSGFLKGEFQRDFDLNNGPGLDDDTSEPFFFNQQTRAGLQPRISVGNVRMNSPEIGNFSSWYPSANTYSTITVPSVFHDAGNKSFPIISPQKMTGPSAGPVNPDVYRGPVLSSSPAVHYTPASFQYPVFPFGTSFPLAPATFSGVSTPFMDSSSSGRFNLPGVNPQLLGPAVADPSLVQRPYMVGLPDKSSNSGTESSRKWSRQGLDLNAGPGVVDVEGRDETMLLASRQFPVASSQAPVEGQARMHHLSVGTLKRKESEGSWETENLKYKQSPWQ